MESDLVGTADRFADTVGRDKRSFTVSCACRKELDVLRITAANAHAKVNTKLAVTKARAKEKAKGRIRRVAVAVPMIGVAIAGAFEYANYTEWQSENPDGDFQQYGKETLEVSKQVVDEVLQELPEEIRPSREKLLSTYAWITGAAEPDLESSDQDDSTIDSWIDWMWGGQQEPPPLDPRTLTNP